MTTSTTPGPSRSSSRKPLSRLLVPAAAFVCLGLGTALLWTGGQRDAGVGVGDEGAAAAPTPRTPLVQLTPANDGPADTPDGEINFNRDIRPILSDRCFACHGPDANISDDAGGFRLDVREESVAELESGGTPIVPGDPDASELISRITSQHESLVMPPPQTNLTVSPAEAQLLRRWIEQGAHYEGHWAYQTPQRPQLPDVADELWAFNGIDYFIAEGVENAGLPLSPMADRQTLIRRVYLDLIGLPPTPAEVDAFINDQSDDAYEQVVDRLLDNPHFGERMAVIWLDAARYADTNGFHHDNIRTAWPWRQWVIEAFNSNMPYDQFVIEQLAGDLLPDATQQQVLASAFCRMHNINDETGSIDAEFRVEAIADRIETIATVFMAQTFTCARCHDHKYDPIAQDDYYSTYAFFNSIDQERGVYGHSMTTSRAYPPNIMWRPEELQQQVTAVEAQLTEARNELAAANPDIAQELADWERPLRESTGVVWADTELTAAASTHAGTQVAIQDGGSALLSGNDPPANEDITLTLRTDATGLRLLRLDALTHDSFHEQGLGRSPNGNAVLSQLVVQAVSVADPTQIQDVTLGYAWADTAQQDGDYDVLNALRDDALGWAVGGQNDNAPRTALFFADEPFGFEGGTELRITLRHQSQHAQHTLGHVRIALAQANDQALAFLPTVSEDWFQIGPFDAQHPQDLQTRFGPEDATAINPQAEAIRDSQWTHLPALRDGSLHTFRSGRNAFFFGRSVFSPVQREIEITIGQYSAVQIYRNGELVHAREDPTRLEGYDTLTITLLPGENIIVAKVLKTGQGGLYYDAAPTDGPTVPLQPLALVDADDRHDAMAQAYVNSWRDHFSPSVSDVIQRIAQLEADLAELNEQAVPVLVMREAAQPRPAYILSRGAYDAEITTETRTFGPFTTTLWPTEPQERKPPAMVNLPMPEDAPSNRLGYAQWLVQPEHPLTSRVHVNRIWQMIFGTGIVATVEDFGSQADWPSHPELLDYLAIEFVASGWDQKALIREIVTSATYRQQAVATQAALALDPDNRLLSHFPRRRLTGEFIRDQALYVSGLLNDEIGGPSVRPYQPPGLWYEVAINGNSNTRNFVADSGDLLYRRSMYTFWKRTSPPPQMQIFNAPTREFCVVSRDITNTPLQVLTIWNDQQYLEASRVLAQRTLAEAETDEDRLALIFRRCTGRTPNAQVLDILGDALSYYRERYTAAPDDAAALLTQGEYPLPETYHAPELAAWMMIASTAFSLDETIVRD